MNKFDQGITEGILFTDQYQVTMAQLYYRLGLHEKPVQFEHFFRSNPDYGFHKAGYCINAGLEWLLDWMQNRRFEDRDIRYLRGQETSNGRPLFADDFLHWLRQNGSFEGVSIRAIPEGRVVHPNVPLTVVRGPLAMLQILETPLLSQLNYQILIATKASRIRLSGRGQLLMEFGSRRAHDRGANAGVRAALIGGADFSSNVGISHVLGVPPKGTHSHSMVQLFLSLGMSEEDAFRSFSTLYPDDCILLVDTVNTLESGIPNAIKIFEELRKKGHRPVGVRLDSGDLAHLSIQAARMLDAAGFADVKIVLSNELDELAIWQIITQIAEEAQYYGVDADGVIDRLTYGVGTRLITSAGCSALGGVFKLVAVHDENTWKPAMKISENLSKVPNPGEKTVWRLYDRRQKASCDLIALRDEDLREYEEIEAVHPADSHKSRTIRRGDIAGIESLLVDILDDGELVYGFPPLEEIRKVREQDLGRLDTGVKRLLNPHIYHVSLTRRLMDLKLNLLRTMR